MKLFPCEEKLKPDPYADKQLPPVDGGIHAWLFLAACAMIEALVWGSLPFLLSLLFSLVKPGPKLMEPRICLFIRCFPELLSRQ